MDFDDTFGYFRHLNGEQLAQKLRVGARKQHLRTATGLQHFIDIAAHGVSLTVALTANLLLIGNGRLCPAQVQHDIAVTNLLDRARLQHANAPNKLFVNALAFGLAHALYKNLLGRLYRIATKVREIELLHDNAADLGCLVNFARIVQGYFQAGLFDFFDDVEVRHDFHRSRIRINLGKVVFGIAIPPFGGRYQGVLQRLHNHLAVDVFLSSNLAKRLYDAQIGHLLNPIP